VSLVLCGCAQVDEWELGSKYTARSGVAEVKDHGALREGGAWERAIMLSTKKRQAAKTCPLFG
jgi:hypothetical protein